MRISLKQKRKAATSRQPEVVSSKTGSRRHVALTVDDLAINIMD